MVRNLAKARAVWWRMTRILSREGEEPRVSGFFCKDVVQLVLIFIAETWVVTSCMGRVLGGFQDYAARQFTGGQPWRRAYEKWEYTLVVAAREEAGFKVM